MKVKLNVGTKEVWGELVPVVDSREQWNEYLLTDQSLIKMKTVVTEIYRLEDEYDEEENPIYFVKSSHEG